MKTNKEQQLLKHLSLVQRITLKETMELFNISESTARRLFTKLESNHLAVRIHGGLQYIFSTTSFYSFENGIKENSESKIAIGRKACELIEDGDIIFCDSGTTIKYFCSELSLFLKSKKLNVTFYTNSVANIDILSPIIEVNLIGGKYRANRKDFSGYIAEKSLSNLIFTKCFIGADGCNNNKNFTTTDFETAKIDELAVKSSKETILLVDSTKFMKSSHIVHVTADDISKIVTDSNIQKNTIKDLESNGIKVIIAE